MRRKHAATAALNNGNDVLPDAPPSPNPTGAMDTLLEKLRAAAPATRDTRDRRRRARLNDRHQKRVASGQQIPELPGVPAADGTEGESGLLSPPIETAERAIDDKDAGVTSEGEDIADRAASLLQGLRGDGEGDGVNRDDSIRVRRRRESADDERIRRRRRRPAKDSVDSTNPQTPVVEESENREEDGLPETPGRGLGIDTQRSYGDDTPSDLPSPPVTVIVPPSPTRSEMAATEDGDKTPQE